MSNHLTTCVRPSLAAGAAALVLTLLTPADGSAQQTRRVVISDLPIAEQLEIRTRAMASDKDADRLLLEAETAHRTGTFLQAADLFEQSARLRTPGDSRGGQGFEKAGNAYFSADEPARASRAWEEAGNRALILGDVFVASQNFMRAAMAAQEAGDRVRTSDLGWKAYYLTESPQLSEEQKRQLRQHIRTSSE